MILVWYKNVIFVNISILKIPVSLWIGSEGNVTSYCHWVRETGKLANTTASATGKLALSNLATCHTLAMQNQGRYDGSKSTTPMQNSQSTFSQQLLNIFCSWTLATSTTNKKYLIYCTLKFYNDLNYFDVIKIIFIVAMMNECY